MLRDPDYGREYLQEYNLNYVENRLFEYPEDHTVDDMGSQASSYNMFLGFQGNADTMSVSVQSKSRHDSGNNLVLTKNNLKIRSLHERHSTRM